MGGDAAAFIIIGNEILSGKVREENLLPLTSLLRERGIRLGRVVVIPDDVELIATEVRALSQTYSYVFTSGGVGPTHDDVTMRAIASAFGVPLARNKQLETLMRNHYGESLREEHLIMADVPDGARMLSTATAPWPVTVKENVWILPGVPEVFRYKMKILQEHLEKQGSFESRAAFTKMDEALLKPLLDRCVATNPAIEIGSYPKWEDPTYMTKVTFDGSAVEEVNRAFEQFLKMLPTGEPQWTE